MSKSSSRLPDAQTELEARLRFLHESARLLDSPAGLQEVLEKTFVSLLHQYQLSSCLVFVLTPENELRAEYSGGVSVEFARTWTARPGEGIVGIVFSSGNTRLVAETSDEESDPLLRELVRRQQVRSSLLVPLMVDGRILGTAAFFSRNPKNFTPAHVDALTLFSQQAALAVRNSRRMAELQAFNRRLESEMATAVHELTRTNQRLIQKVRELKSVYELALATAASTKMEDIIRVIIGGIKELVEVQGGAFFLLDSSSGWLEAILPAFDRTAASSPTLNCKVEESKFLQHVIRQGQPQILNFVDSADQLPASWKSIAVRSILALPLKHEDRVEGIFCVVNKLNGLFSEDDIRVLTLLTGRVTEVLRRLALDQELRQRVQDLSVLQEINTQMTSPPVLSDTVNSIGRITRKALTGTDLCLFFLHHSGSEALAMMGGDWDSRLNFDAKALTTGVSEKVPLAGVFRDSQAACFEKGAASQPWDKDLLVQTLDLQGLLYLPLTVDQGTIGVLAIGTGPGRQITLEHRRLAGLISKQVSIIVERSRLYERLLSANEKLERINHLKNEFISMVSHELRTPLTTIKGFVSIVLNEETGTLNKQQQHFLETADRAIDRLTLLVSDLLDISRIEAGQIKMQLRPTNLRDIFARVSTNFEPQLKAGNLTLKLQISEHLPMVLADPHRLTQVLDNLMSNAIKFTSQGGITIAAVDKGDYVMVSVKDTGQGIARPEQERIFDKFYQIKVGSAYPAKGTGLGLAIVKSIIESHRGKVWVDSDPGKGADFRFILPRAKSDASGDGLPT